MKNRAQYQCLLEELERRLGLEPGEELIDLRIDHARATATIVTRPRDNPAWLAPGEGPAPGVLRPAREPAQLRAVKDNPQA